MLTVDFDRLGLRPGERVLDMGCGAGRHAFEMYKRGADVIAFDQDADELAIVREWFAAMKDAGEVPVGAEADVKEGDALALPFADGEFDRIVAAEILEHIPADIQAIEELVRVLRPGGRLVFSVTHPMRWIFPDDPQVLEAQISYFEREYTETAEDGTIVYAEFHRTLGDWIRALHDAGFHLRDLQEPEWPEHLTQTWGQWSPERGRIFPGSAIFVAEKQ